MEVTVSEIANFLKGKLLKGDDSICINNFSSLENANENSVTFFSNIKYIKNLEKTKSGLILVSSTEIKAPNAKSILLVKNPILAFDDLIKKYFNKSSTFVPGVHNSVNISKDITLNEDKVSIKSNVAFGNDIKIGNGTEIGSGSYIGNKVEIGEFCRIGPNVSIMDGSIIKNRVIIHPGSVIGADGFGFEFCDGKHRKISQVGIVRIENDVEIGSLTTIDRARFGETIIGEGTKIDNQVQIAHNVAIGKHCIIVSQVGIAGSSTIGDYVVIAAQSGIAGHIKIADRVTLGGRSGVISSIETAGETYFGYPAKLLKESRKENMFIKQIGSLIKRVKNIESKIQN